MDLVAQSPRVASLGLISAITMRVPAHAGATAGHQSGLVLEASPRVFSLMSASRNHGNGCGTPLGPDMQGLSYRYPWRYPWPWVMCDGNGRGQLSQREKPGSIRLMAWWPHIRGRLGVDKLRCCVFGIRKWRKVTN